VPEVLSGEGRRHEGCGRSVGRSVGRQGKPRCDFDGLDLVAAAELVARLSTELGAAKKRLRELLGEE
jgi:hypothetical protein